MAGSHVEEGGEQVRGKDSGPSTWGRKDKSRDAISSLKGRFVRLELGVADTKEGKDLLEQSMEKAVEDLKVQIQDLQEGMQSSSIHAVSHEEFVTFQDRVLSMLSSLESRVEVLTKHEEKLRQEVAIYKTALSARVMATHEAPRVEVPKPGTFSGKQDAMAVAESLMDYKESMSSIDEGSRVSHSSGGGEEVSPKGSEDDCSTDGGEEVPRSTARHGKGKVSYTRKDKGKRKQQESTPKLKCFLCDGPHLTRECPKRKALSTLIEKSEKTMEDGRLGSIQMIGALQVMLEAVGQFGLYYSEQTQGILRSLVATLSLLRRVIESQGEDTEISSIRDRVQLDTGDEGWAIHTNGSLRYRGPVVVPQLVELRDEILREFHCSRFFSASRWQEDV